MIFRIAFILWTAFISTVGSPLLVLPGEPGYRWSWLISRIWGRGSLWLLKVMCYISYRGEGANPHLHEPCVFAIKHQSAWETIFFMMHLAEPCFVLKEELLQMPVYGWYLKRMGMIGVDRSKGVESLRKAATLAKKRVDQGRSIIIFPEGTREAYGTPARAKPGVYAICSQMPEVKCVPIAVDSGKYWPKRGKMVAGVVRFYVHDPLVSGLSRGAFLGVLNTQMDSLTKAS